MLQTKKQREWIWSVFPQYSGAETIREPDIMEFLANRKILGTMFDWDHQKMILSIDFSLTNKTRNFWVTMKYQEQPPETLQEMEKQLQDRFYRIENNNDRNL